jgi:hypothetical protein
MGVDQPGDQQPPAGLDHLVAGLGRDLGLHRGDGTVFDQEVGAARAMDVAIMLVDLPAADQQSRGRHLRFSLDPRPHPATRKPEFAVKNRALSVFHESEGKGPGDRMELKRSSKDLAPASAQGGFK